MARNESKASKWRREGEREGCGKRKGGGRNIGWIEKCLLSG